MHQLTMLKITNDAHLGRYRSHTTSTKLITNPAANTHVAMCQTSMINSRFVVLMFTIIAPSVAAGNLMNIAA